MAMQDELILIDQLEDQLIDNPDASTKKELYDTSLDETFQKKLNARAEQIANQNNDEDNEDDAQGRSIANNYLFLVTKTHLAYDYRDYGSLENELSEWFAFNDFSVLGGLQRILETYDNHKHRLDISDIELVEKCISKVESQDGKSLESLVYFALGKYRHCNDKEKQLHSINDNCKVLFEMGLFEKLTLILQTFIAGRIESDSKDVHHLTLSKNLESRYFKALTLFYFMINVILEDDDLVNLRKLRESLAKSDILSDFIRFIEHWKWNHNRSYRARYLFMIVWKLILIEMGDSSHLSKVNDFLIDMHGIVNKRGKDIPSNKLTCSPLDYFTFREDLTDRFPLYKDDEAKLLSKRDIYEFSALKEALEEDNKSIDNEYQYFMSMNSHSNSLSNLLENPRPNKSHTILSQLPAQTVHIATPVPSPPSAPSDYMSGGEKIRKLYQTNQGMPFIYPKTNEAEVPYAIKEASDILKNSVYESYSNKQLWNERQKFMIQERGFIDEYDDDKSYQFDEFEYSDDLFEKYPDRKDEIHSLLRVESFYKKNLCRFHSLVLILIETMKSNKLDYSLNFAEWELNPESSHFNNDKNVDMKSKAKIDFVLMQQLEVVKIKEITLKATSSIINLLLKWFKTSNVLKYYYFSSILFDDQYFNVLFEYMTRAFNNSDLQEFYNNKDGKDDHDNVIEYEILINQNQLMNPQIKLPRFEFFNNCCNDYPNDHKYEFINKTSIQKLPNEIDSNNISNITIKRFNENFCFILVNLLNITNKVLIKNLTQRIFTLNELKPTELFKIVLLNYDNEFINKPILKILKKLIPYQGRKWKSINMDLISKIYLNCRLGLRDNWLSGKDLENDFNNSFDQEIALRALLQFYNIKNYPLQMESLGYQISTEEIPNINLDDNLENFDV